MNPLIILLKREWLIAFKAKGEWVNGLLFWLISLCVFALSLSPGSKVMDQVTPAVIWLCVIFVSFMLAERVLQPDFQQGMLVHMHLSAYPLSLLMAIKVLVFWLFGMGPILLLTPLVGYILQLSSEVIWVVIATLVLGTPALCLMTTLGTALTLHSTRASVLLATILLPLLMPIIIFATSAVNKAQVQSSYQAELALLAAMGLGSLLFLPFAIAGAVKAAIHD